MKTKYRKIINLVMVLILTIVTTIPITLQAEASSNHLLVINSRTNKMGYFVNNELVKEFRVATGKKSTPTPQGKFQIVNKIKNRPYYSGGIPGGDPRNPLGDRWLGLHVGVTYGSTYGIHGNNDESSIGKHISGGCIRMHNKDVRWLFDQIPNKSWVIIKDTDQSFEQIAAGYGIKLYENKPGWKKENGKWYYIKEDGKYQKNGWLKIEGKYYYFDSYGVMQTGWERVDNKWYYLNEDGSMRIGWLKKDNKWYYLHNWGEMEIGWEKIDGTWYYFDSTGMMQTGWEKIDGVWYYLDSTGAMQTGWEKIDGVWYYFDSTGIMQTGWEKIDGTWYYLHSWGEMEIGWEKIDGVWYYFDSWGAMQTGWKRIDGIWYYFYSTGNMATNTTIDGWIIDNDGVATEI